MSKAVILAAGRGVRMGALTEALPKPLLPLAGKPMIEHILDGFRAAGFVQAFLVTGYRAELIEERLTDYPLDIEFHRQETLNGTGAATLLAKEFAANDPFVLTFGDIVIDSTHYQRIAAQLSSRPETTAVLGVNHVDDPYQGAAVYEEAGVVTRIIEKPPQGTSTTNWNNAGLFAFRPSIFDYLERISPSPRGEYELPTAIEQMISEGRRLEIYPVAGAWRDVGRPDDIAAAERLLKQL